MKIKHIIITSAVVVFLSINLLLIPHLHRRKATFVVINILTYLKDNDPAKAMDYWEDINAFPPMYGLTSYKIEKKFFNKKDGAYYATFHIVLNFSPNNVMPSEKIWVMELKKKGPGWRVKNFHIQKE